MSKKTLIIIAASLTTLVVGLGVYYFLNKRRKDQINAVTVSPNDARDIIKNAGVGIPPVVAQ